MGLGVGESLIKVTSRHVVVNIGWLYLYQFPSPKPQILPSNSWKTHFPAISFILTLGPISSLDRSLSLSFFRSQRDF
ncbi:hypothetical protein CMV_012651 [Castanea mollissima]|uniref:Uncharacterized protein n=1 Tax=Castanea mollissima TaxID=60419 RepID=A0A8J4VVU0_9ROSI|nr:hypothetical protein CMV_012651 [Castanea mollissima]